MKFKNFLRFIPAFGFQTEDISAKKAKCGSLAKEIKNLLKILGLRNYGFICPLKF